MTAQSPCPWHRVGNSVYAANGTCITEAQWGEVGHVEYPNKASEATANAEFIVRACNALDEIEWLCDGREDIDGNGGPNLAMQILQVIRGDAMTARNDTTQRTPGLWRVEYDNDTGPDDEGFDEWWTVYDGERVVGWFSSEEEAQAIASVPTLRAQNAMLRAALEAIAAEPWSPYCAHKLQELARAALQQSAPQGEGA